MMYVLGLFIYNVNYLLLYVRSTYDMTTHIYNQLYLLQTDTTLCRQSIQGWLKIETTYHLNKELVSLE